MLIAWSGLTVFSLWLPIQTSSCCEHVVCSASHSGYWRHKLGMSYMQWSLPPSFTRTSELGRVWMKNQMTKAKKQIQLKNSAGKYSRGQNIKASREWLWCHCFFVQTKTSLMTLFQSETSMYKIVRYCICFVFPRYSFYLINPLNTQDRTHLEREVLTAFFK